MGLPCCKCLLQNEAMKSPHMWIPNTGPEPFDEVCALCGVFSGAHHKRPDPPEASLPCPEPWPEEPPPPPLPELTDDERERLERSHKFKPDRTLDEMERDEVSFKCPYCEAVNTYDAWLFSGRCCPDCGSNHGAIRP